MKMSWIIIVITSLFFYQACGDKEDNCHKTITFVNKTADALYVVANSDYPDTMAFRNQPNPLLDSNFTKVLSNENNTQALWRRDCIELAFKDLIPSDTLMIYVFDSEVLENTPWETVKTNYLILKRYDLSLQDLKNTNWTITYQ
jgi:hypothetical protein